MKFATEARPIRVGPRHRPFFAEPFAVPAQHRGGWCLIWRVRLRALGRLAEATEPVLAAAQLQQKEAY
jgi:hypothetical protein